MQTRVAFLDVKKGCSDLNIDSSMGSGRKKSPANIRNSATGYFGGELKLLRTARI